MYISRLQVRLMAGRIVIWVDPRAITGWVGTSEPTSNRLKRALVRCGERVPAAAGAAALLHRVAYNATPFVTSARDFHAPTPVTEDPRYAHVRDFLQHRGPVTGTLWFEMLSRQIGRDGYAVHKSIVMRDRSDIESFLNHYVQPIAESLQRDGFDMSLGTDLGGAVIGPRGDIFKAEQGNHRFLIARELGVARFPLRILAVHRDWYERAVGARGVSALPQAIAALDGALLLDRETSTHGRLAPVAPPVDDGIATVEPEGPAGQTDAGR